MVFDINRGAQLEDLDCLPNIAYFLAPDTVLGGELLLSMSKAKGPWSFFSFRTSCISDRLEDV